MEEFHTALRTALLTTTRPPSSPPPPPPTIIGRAAKTKATRTTKTTAVFFIEFYSRCAEKIYIYFFLHSENLHGQSIDARSFCLVPVDWKFSRIF